MVNKILKELDQMIDLQEIGIERDMQTKGSEDKVYFKAAKLLAYREVARMIAKVSREAATSKDTQMNINSLTQENYNTDGKKSEIRRLVLEILDICLKANEDEEGFIDEASDSDGAGIVFYYRTGDAYFSIHSSDTVGKEFFNSTYLDGALSNSKKNLLDEIVGMKKNLIKAIGKEEEGK